MDYKVKEFNEFTLVNNSSFEFRFAIAHGATHRIYCGQEIEFTLAFGKSLQIECEGFGGFVICNSSRQSKITYIKGEIGDVSKFKVCRMHYTLEILDREI